MFPAHLQISRYLQIYRSVSPDLQICIVTLSHTYTRRGNPTPTLQEIRNKELKARNARHPKSSAIAEARNSPEVQHRSLHDVYMAPESLLDLPHVRSPHGSLMRPSCSPASSPTTMARDAQHTH